MSSGRPRVLILDGMWNKTLAAVRSLGSRGFHVTVGERTRLATALFSRYCSERLIYPSPSEKPEAFLYAIENQLALGNYDVMLPMEWNTQRLLTDPLVRHRFEKFARIPYVNSDIAELVNDKANAMRYAKSHGVGVPETFFVENKEDLGRVADMVGYPAVIKPRISSGSRGMMYVKDKRAMIKYYPLVHQRYHLPMVQEYIPGDEIYGVAMLLNFVNGFSIAFLVQVFSLIPTIP